MKKLFVILLCLPLLAHAETIEMKVNGLVCAFCAQGIEKKLRALGETDEVYVSLERGWVALTLKKGQSLTDTALTELLKEAGYTVVGVAHSERSLAELKAGAP